MKLESWVKRVNRKMLFPPKFNKPLARLQKVRKIPDRKCLNCLYEYIKKNIFFFKVDAGNQHSACGLTEQILNTVS